MMNIVFISGVKFGREVLKYILQKGINISLIFSYCEDKKKFYSDYASFDDISKQYDVRNVKVSNINDEENIHLLQKTKPDLILVMGWSQLLKDEIINIPKIGIIGSHSTELPKYRGRAPIPWTIIKGLKKSALTFFWIQKGVDDGDILDQQIFTITKNDDASTIYEIITKIGKKMLTQNLREIEKGIIKRVRQDPNKFIESWPKRTPRDGKIEWNWDCTKIHRLIRATTNPYPGAFTFFNKDKLTIWQAKSFDEKFTTPGKILDVSEKGVLVGTNHGKLLITIASLNNKQINLLEIFSKNDLGKILG